MSAVLSSSTLAPLLEAPKKASKKQPGKQNAQAQLTQFWSKYHSKTPARVTSVFPKKLYDGLVPVEDTPGPQLRNAARSYEEARTKCRELVKRAVAECERMNCRFSDAEFDIETDLANHDNNCLFGLGSNGSPCCGADDNDDSEDDDKARKVNAFEMENALKNIAKSEILKDGSANFEVDKLRKYVGFGAFSGYRIYRPGPESVHRIDWIFENPQFTVDGYSSSDIKQGRCGDCWWLAGLASLAHRKDIMDKICVARDEECGVYGFVFWKDGEWISTIIDDNLYLTARDYGDGRETYDSSGKKARRHRKEKQTGSKALYFSHCENENETWLPLLEKAYAKVHGDYEALDGGWSGIAVEDLTGGVTTVVAGNSVLRKDRLWRELVRSGEEDGEFVFALSAKSGWRSTNGIQLNHAYSVLKAVEVQDDDGKRHRLVRVRNPWGEKSSEGVGEWCGAWADGSKEWTSYMIQKMNHKPDNDGNFWISYSDLLDTFQYVHRTRLFNERWTIAQQWTSSKVSWVTGYIDKKFIIEVKGSGMVVIVLSQLDDRYFKSLEGQYEFSLDFLLRKVGTKVPLCQVRPVHKYDTRSANCELELEEGVYEVLPKVTAERDSSKKTIGKMVSTWADKNPAKLRQIGMQYDAAHAKAGVLDEDVEVERQREESKKKKQKRKEKKKQEEKKIKKMQKTLLEKRANTEGEEDEDDSAVEETVMKWISKRLKKKKGGKLPSGLNSKLGTQSRKSTDTGSYKTSLLEGSNKDADSDGEGSGSSESGGSNTPPSTIKGDEKEKKDDSDIESEDLSDSSEESEEEDPDFDKKQPWDPVCVMGLRVYAQDAVATITLDDTKPVDALMGKEDALNVVKS